ncbi:hypothetical protein K1719_021468 [Acacia pycnantha]|nr:hypothetical protein K1719_021468 [Acacia pycnantha]
MYMIQNLEEGFAKLVCGGGAKANDAVQFIKAASDAEEVGRTTHPKHKAEQELPLILSAELKLAGVTFLVSDLSADDSATPKSLSLLSPSRLLLAFSFLAS